MSLSRRLRLLAWAAAAGAWVLEDDFDSEYRYAGRPGDRGTAHVHPFGDLSDRACTAAQALEDPPSRRISQRIQDPLSVSCHLPGPNRSWASSAVPTRVPAGSGSDSPAKGSGPTMKLPSQTMTTESIAGLRLPMTASQSRQAPELQSIQVPGLHSLTRRTGSDRHRAVPGHADRDRARATLDRVERRCERNARPGHARRSDSSGGGSKFLLTEAVEITSSPDGSCDLCGGPLAWVVDWPQRGQARWLCPTCASWPALALSEAFAILRDDERERPAGEVENGHRLASHLIALPGREGA